MPPDFGRDALEAWAAPGQPHRTRRLLISQGLGVDRRQPARTSIELDRRGGQPRFFQQVKGHQLLAESRQSMERLLVARERNPRKSAPQFFREPGEISRIMKDPIGVPQDTLGRRERTYDGFQPPKHRPAND